MRACDGGRDFQESHKADGADVSGCSQVYPAAPWMSRDSSPSRPPLRIPPRAGSPPASGLRVNICMYTAQPGHMLQQNLALDKEQALILCAVHHHHHHRLVLLITQGRWVRSRMKTRLVRLQLFLKGVACQGAMQLTPHIPGFYLKPHVQ